MYIEFRPIYFIWVLLCIRFVFGDQDRGKRRAWLSWQKYFVWLKYQIYGWQNKGGHRDPNKEYLFSKRIKKRLDTKLKWNKANG